MKKFQENDLFKIKKFQVNDLLKKILNFYVSINNFNE